MTVRQVVWGSSPALRGIRLCVHSRGHEFDPWWGTPVLHAACCAPTERNVKKREEVLLDYSVLFFFHFSKFRAKVGTFFK